MRISTENKYLLLFFISEQDLAPNYAGTLYGRYLFTGELSHSRVCYRCFIYYSGLINFIGTTTGFLTPWCVSFFNKNVSSK